MMQVLILILALAFGLLNGFVVADSYNKMPFSDFDRRGIYKSKLALMLLLLAVPIIPALIGSTLVGSYFGLIALALTLLVTRASGKVFLGRRLVIKQAKLQAKIDKLK